MFKVIIHDNYGKNDFWDWYKNHIKSTHYISNDTFVAIQEKLN